MHFTTLFTLLAVGYGAMAQNPTVPEADPTPTPIMTILPQPIKNPGAALSCYDSGHSALSNTDGICSSAGGKFNIFSGCCLESSKSAAFTQGCTDNGGTAKAVGDGVCELGA